MKINSTSNEKSSFLISPVDSISTASHRHLRQFDVSKLRPNKLRQGRIQTLLARKKNGIRLTAAQQSALELVDKFQISLPTAYRWLKKGITDPGERRVGRDGKFRMVPKSGYVSPVYHHLLRAANEFRHASSFADNLGISGVEIELLTSFCLDVQETLARWGKAR